MAELERSLLNSRRANNETQISMEIMWGTENMYAHSPVNLFPYDPDERGGAALRQVVRHRRRLG